MYHVIENDMIVFSNLEMGEAIHYALMSEDVAVIRIGEGKVEQIDYDPYPHYHIESWNDIKGVSVDYDVVSPYTEEVILKEGEAISSVHVDFLYNESVSILIANKSVWRIS